MPSVSPAIVAAGALAVLGASLALRPKSSAPAKQAKGKQSTASELEGFSRERINRLDDWLERYVDSGKLSCVAACITRNDQTVYLGYKGNMDIEQKKPVQLDTIYRIYSMTKAVTSVAAMMLWEEGRFQLNDPISSVLPQFKDMQVYVSGALGSMVTEPARRPITFRHLLSHTSGLTYHFFRASPVDELYRQHDIDFLSPQRTSLKDLVDRLARVPLVCHPGERWNYGVSDDVLAYLVEVLSGVPFAQFVQQRIFDPLGMVDTHFTVPSSKAHRVATCYVPFNRDGQFGTVQLDPPSRTVLAMPCGRGSYCNYDGCLHTHPEQRTRSTELETKIAAGEFGGSAVFSPLGTTVPSGGGGLCSTLSDYSHFARMLTNQGQLHGTRLLSPRTVALMGQNHLPDGKDLEECGNRIFAETSYHGIGFGLGFAVDINSVKSGSICPGTLSWGGMASTFFFLDTKARISCVFMTQLVPSSTYAELRRNLQTLIYSSLIEE